VRILRREDRNRKTSRYRVPNFSLGREQLRVKPCSIVTARAPDLASPVLNETGTARHRHPADDPIRTGSPGHVSPPQRTRNDSRSPTRNRPQLQRPPSACSLSSRTSIAHEPRISNIFFLRIDGWRHYTRSNSSRRDSFRWFNWFFARLVKLRLLDSRRH